jgi:hypothetical protein
MVHHLLGEMRTRQKLFERVIAHRVSDFAARSFHLTTSRASSTASRRA